jgi:hypothetical protein
MEPNVQQSRAGMGFIRLSCEWCVYYRKSPCGTTIFILHVDDIISASSSLNELNRFRDELKSQWEISDLRPIKHALGIAVSHIPSSRLIHLSQTALIDRVLEQSGQRDIHPTDTPMVQGFHIERSDKSIPYQELVRSLMYIANTTRPDISFAVGRLASIMDCYTTDHWKAAIRVLRYLKGTHTLCLQLSGLKTLDLVRFSDSDYANCRETSKSIGGYCFNMGTGSILWCSHKQKTVTDSLCYAEYIALSKAVKEAIFLHMVLEGTKFLNLKPSQVFCDNDAAIKLTEDQVWHSKCKHIHIKYHFVRDQVLAHEIKVNRVHTNDNLADIFTKSLGRGDFL